MDKAHERSSSNDSERERARADREEVPLSGFLDVWPTSLSDSLTKTKRAWSALTPTEQADALSGVSSYLAQLRRDGRRHTPSGARYLEKKPWARMAGQEGPSASISTSAFDCWSREWWAALLSRIERGVSVGFMLTQLISTGSRSGPSEPPTCRLSVWSKPCVRSHRMATCCRSGVPGSKGEGFGCHVGTRRYGFTCRAQSRRNKGQSVGRVAA